LAAALLVPIARADPITLTMSGSFADGGTFSGSINYDPDTLSATTWSVHVAGGNTSQFPAFTYNTANSIFGTGGVIDDHRILQLNDNNNNRYFDVAFNPDMTDAGGSTNVYVSAGNSVELTISPFNTRNITAGTATGTPVPEPTSLALLGLSACLLVRRRRVVSATNN
jgi:hypothetical protein